MHMHIQINTPAAALHAFLIYLVSSSRFHQKLFIHDKSIVYINLNSSSA